jgi:hypothetical protein
VEQGWPEVLLAPVEVEPEAEELVLELLVGLLQQVLTITYKFNF